MTAPWPWCKWSWLRCGWISDISYVELRPHIEKFNIESLVAAIGVQLSPALIADAPISELP